MIRISERKISLFKTRNNGIYNFFRKGNANYTPHAINDHEDNNANALKQKLEKAD
jgi:hypothetical protein